VLIFFPSDAHCQSEGVLGLGFGVVRLMAMMFNHMWAFWVLGFFFQLRRGLQWMCVFGFFIKILCPSPKILEDFALHFEIHCLIFTFEV
jgi:hypothetical protein